MHSILWVSILASAGVAVVTTLLVEYLAKPWLEARKDRILEKKREMRDAIKGILQVHNLLGRLLVDKKHIDYELPEEYLRKVTDQHPEKVDGVLGVLDLPLSIGRQWDRAAATIHEFEFQAQVGEVPDWDELESASNVLFAFYFYFDEARWHLLKRRRLINLIKPTRLTRKQNHRWKTRDNQ
jgi:hypothetical protein